MRPRHHLLPAAGLLGLLALHPGDAGAYVPTPGPGGQDAVAQPGGAPPSAAAPGTATPAPVPTARVIVKYRDDNRFASPAGATASAQTLSQRAGVALQHLRVTGGGEQVLSLPAPASGSELDAVMDRIWQDP